ncbi:hypothetical protein FYJ74_07640 [Pyramidobacter sp. SM-530-WT-4B]|uniref:AtpZ/AtpI family protein n=1 Tax=Pyramidobacter porci TaxID=2605789 RepID=A0A6L5YE89_9BACT|nr:hypothetical protein [Pyramidobacter porci]MCI6260938.1 hypothetical protein [Pyramidobacter sp.]MST55902.1 hypothetical protein [Pyramidobacter porci]
MKIPNVRDIIVFSRIVGAALLVCGYLLGGLFIGRCFLARGYPQWTLPLCLIAGLIGALLSGVYELKSILAMIRRDRQNR